MPTKKVKKEIHSGYVVKFNKKDKNGNIVTIESVDLSQFEQWKSLNRIIDYKVDDYGVLVIYESMQY